MKTLKNIFAIIVLTTIFASCTPTTDINEDAPTELNVTDGNDGNSNDNGKD